MMHEYQHLITLSRFYLSDAYRERFEQGVRADFSRESDETTWLTEFLSAGATVLTCPDNLLDYHLPNWFGANQVLLEATLPGLADIQPDQYNMALRGWNVFDWSRVRSYSLLAFLALFAFDKGGEDVFIKTIDLWENQRQARGY